MAGKLRCELWLREGIELLNQSDCDICGLLLFSLSTQFVPNLSAAEEDSTSIGDFFVRDNPQEITIRKLLNGRSCIGMSQHALGSEHNQRFAPRAQRLATEQMKILSGRRGLADLDIVSGC